MKKVDTFQKFWFLGLIPTVVSMWVLVNTQCFKVANLLEIEFANNFHVFSILIKKHDQMVLVNNHMFDFFFILCYSVLFILSLKLISLALDFHFKTRVYLICLIPGLLDVLENILFLGLVQDCSYFFEAYFWSVRIKWESWQFSSFILC